MTIRASLIALSMVFAMAANAQAPAEASVSYTVQPGDKLITLGSKLLIDPKEWAEVARLNAIEKTNSIAIGQKIVIPLRLMRWAPSAARLVSANGAVQINGAPAVVGAAISEGDRIGASANSSAVVQLEDGSRIQLMPNSLAELLKHRQYGLKDERKNTHWFAGLLRLTQGAIEALVTPGAQRASPLQVITPTSVVGVRGTHFRVAIDGQARSEVIEGLVVAENPAQGATADLPAGTGAVIQPEEKTIEVKQLLAAPDLSDSPAQRQPGQAWSWPAVAGAQAWRVQLASDATFSQIIFEDKLTAPLWSMAGLPLGQWFGRVRAVDNVGLEGFDASRALEIVATPLARWTLQSSALTVENGLSRLRWTPVEAQGQTGAGWRVEVLKDGATVASTSVYAGAGTLTELLALTAGAYTVHIDGQDAQGAPFERQTFQLQVPNGWGTSIMNMIDPLQSKP